MKFDILTNNLLNIYNEAVYRTKRPSDVADTSTKKGSEISKEKSADAEKTLISLYNSFKANPKDSNVLLDLFNTTREFPDDGVIGRKYTKKQFIQGILQIAKNSGRDYGLILPTEFGGEGMTVDQWKVRIGDAGAKQYYDVLKEIINYMNGITQGRNIKEHADGTHDLYYFDSEGNPFRTFVSVKDGRVGSGILTQGDINRSYSKVMGRMLRLPPPVYYIDGEEMPAKYNPKELRGQDLEFVKDALRSDEAKAEHLQRYPITVDEKDPTTGITKTVEKPENQALYGMGGKKGTLPTGKRVNATDLDIRPNE